MATPPPFPSTSPPSAPLGLRMRIWLGCLGGALASAAGIWLVIGVQARPGEVDGPTLVAQLATVALLGVVVGATFAIWLSHRLITQLDGLNAGLETGDVAELRGLPAVAGWGELSDLTQRLQHMIARHRQAVRASEDLGAMRERLTGLRESLDRWLETERWSPVRVENDALGSISSSLNRGLSRLDEIREQNVEAVRKVAAELELALDDARESAEQAERGFVEATALLTTVRELQRLALELDRVKPGASPVATTDDQAEFRAAARTAIEELVTTSADAVEHLATGFLRVHEIVDQVHLIANRATLIALDAAVLSRTGNGEPIEPPDDLRRLVLEVRRATETVSGLSDEVEVQVAAAVDRMRSARERVAERLESVPPARANVAPTPSRAEFDRLLARVREMIQDAAQKGERLSNAGERVSRSAERLVRGLEDENAEVRGVLVRLAAPEAEAGQYTQATEPSPLRLLDRDDASEKETRARTEEQP
jgi:hypothetical protein